MLSSIVVSLLLSSTAVVAFQPSTSSSSPLQRSRHGPRLWLSSSEKGGGDDNDEIDISDQDWRAFRAKLVMQKDETPEVSSTTSTDVDDNDLDGIGSVFDDPTTLPSTLSSSSSSPSLSSLMNMENDQWAYESGNVIEQGAVILGGVEQSYGFGLRQQYFHKAAILVLAHDSQFTRGIILNRPTNYFLDDGEWRVWFGGDVCGLNDEEPELICLHSITDNEAVNKASNVVMNDIQWTSFETAKQLVEAGAAKPSDFWLFAGYAGWGPGQLMGELERQSWYMVATDSQTLLRELAREKDPEPRGAGLETWTLLMTMIGKQDVVNPADENVFDDLMLTEWARENLLTTRAGGGALSLGPVQKLYDGETTIDVGEGSLVRASSRLRSPFLLSYQHLHKSLVLILADDDDLSIGAILNLPSTQGFEISTKDTKTGEETNVAVPLRYGGEHAIQESQGLWLHCSPALRQAGIGAEVGKNRNNIWKCSAKDVTTAIGKGLASPKDFLVCTGVTAWTKGNALSAVDGIQSEVETGKFEVVPVGKTTEEVWSILTQQEVLRDRDLELVWKNMRVSSDAWGLASEKPRRKDRKSGEPFVFNTEIPVEDLADDALRNWICSHLLGIGLSS